MIVIESLEQSDIGRNVRRCTNNEVKTYFARILVIVTVFH